MRGTVFHRRDDFDVCHPTTIVGNDQDRRALTRVADNLNFGCVGGDAVIDKISDCRFERVPKVAKRRCQACSTGREVVRSSHSGILPELVRDSLHYSIRIRLELTFPDRQYSPAGSLQFDTIPRVATNIVAEFFLPEIEAGGGRRGVFTSAMPVPETSMDENRGSILRQYEVRASRQAFFVKSEAETRAVQK